MNTYTKYFKRFSEYGGKEYASFEDFFQDVSSSLDTFPSDSKNGEAIIVLGYSGNGKTTWIDRYIRENPSFEMVSMDTVTRKIIDREGDHYNPEHLLEDFGNLLEEKCSSGKNIVIDGRFLHLLTRLSLTQTLHSYHYSVGVVDLTDNIQNTLIHRIMDCCGEDMGVTITRSNISQYANDPRFQRRYQDIMQFYAFEKKSTFYDEQKDFGIQYLDCDFIVDMDDFDHHLNKHK